jgi:hypothetical protein
LKPPPPRPLLHALGRLVAWPPGHTGFTLTRDALLRLAWFAWLYGRWTAFKDALLARARASWPWRWARATKRHWRLRWAAWRRS